jgi:autotransporter-associated beta strand protein
MRSRFFTRAALALSIAFILPALAVAQTSGTWTNTAGGLWSAAGNWSGGAVASGSGAEANFATLDITGTQTVNLDAAYTLGSLVFGDTGTSSLAGWVVANNGSSSNVLTLAGGSTPTIGVNNMSGGNSGAGSPSGTNGPGAVISAGIAGSQGLTVNRGSGSQVGFLTLSGSNTYTGTTTVSGTSVLVLAGADALGGSTSVSIQAGGALRIADGVTIGQGKTITNSSTGISFEGGLSVAQGTGTWAGGYSGGRVGYMSGTLVLSGSATGALVVSAYGGDSQTVPNLQHGVVLTGSNHAITSLDIFRGVVKLGSTNALTTTGTLNLRAADASNSTAFDLNGFDQQVAALVNSNTGVNATAFLTNSAPTFNTLTVDQATNSTVLAIIQGNLNLTKTGAGNLTLSPRWTPGSGGSGTSTGTNTFAGVTRVDGGTLTLGNANALFGSTVDTDGAGTLSTGALSAATFGALTGTSGFSLTRNAAPFTLSLGGNDVSSTYAATLSGSGGVTKVGTGTLALTGTNTYEGTTTVSVGTLRISSTAALPGFDTTGRYSVADGATLLVDNAIDNNTVATMLGTGNFLANGRIGFDTSAGNRTYSDAITGTVGVVKVGGNTLTLTGSNTLGAIRVMGGTLAFQATANLAGSGQVILNNGAVQFNGGSSSGSLSGRTTMLEGPGRIQADGGLFTIAVIQGAGQLTLGPGTALFVQNSGGTYTGGTVIEAGASIAVGNNAAFGTGSIRFEGGSLRSTQGSARTLANSVTLAGDVTFLASGANVDRNVTFTGPMTIEGASRTITVNTSPVPGETGIFFNGSIGDGDNTLGLTKAGPGTLVLGGSNSYGGTTTVSAGRLAVDGSIAASSGVSVASGATLGGTGTVSAITGAGLIAPGNSAGILTSPSADLSGGLGFAFEFTQAGEPTWGSATASGNDVLRLTDPTTPLIGTATGANVFNIYFLEANQTYLGGLFTDLTSSFESLIADATFNYFVQDAGGAITYEGFTYSEFSAGNVTRSTVQVAEADFAGGTVTGGYTMQFVVVPEPSAWLLAALGLAAAGQTTRRRRGLSRRS